MNDQFSFKGSSIVACGTLRPELTLFRESGFLDADEIFYAPAGLHEIPKVLLRRLRQLLGEAQKLSPKVVVVYGSRCYLDFKNPGVFRLDEDTDRIPGGGAAKVTISSSGSRRITYSAKAMRLSGLFILGFTLTAPISRAPAVEIAVAYNNIAGLKKLGVKKIAPNHCTGSRAMEIFRKAWGDDYIPLGAGDSVTIGDPP